MGHGAKAGAVGHGIEYDATCGQWRVEYGGSREDAGEGAMGGDGAACRAAHGTITAASSAQAGRGAAGGRRRGPRDMLGRNNMYPPPLHGESPQVVPP